jgi:hypothetical protein
MSDQEKKYSIYQNSLETNHISISEFLKFYNWAKQYSYSKVTLDLLSVNYIDANLSAVIISLVHKLKIESKVWVYVEFSRSTISVFFRNGLMAHLQGKGNDNDSYDNRQSTIALTSFSPIEDEQFCSYLRNQFFAHRGLDDISITVKNALKNHYTEVFTNVGLHANTSLPVFTCGQYFPEKKQLRFTLVDLGDGFLPKIFKATNGRISDDKSAIIWATEGINTTKDIAMFGPGGTGLKELKNYCNNNNGSFHICSGLGYVNMLNKRTIENNLRNPFPGSIVNIIMRNI